LPLFLPSNDKLDLECVRFFCVFLLFQFPVYSIKALGHANSWDHVLAQRLARWIRMIPFIVRMSEKSTQQKQLTEWAKNMYFNLLSDAYKLKQLARDKKHTYTLSLRVRGHSTKKKR
jgi:hypothetical protein